MLSSTLITLIFLIAFSAYFSATETAFSSVNRIRLKHYESKGDKRANIALYIVDHFDRALSTILVGNNIVNIAATALATNLAMQYFPEHGTLISTVAMTFIVLAFGEILPKSFAKENSEKFSLLVAFSLRMFMLLLSPFVLLFIGLKRCLDFMIGGKKNKNSLITIGELKYWIKMLREEGDVKPQDVELLDNAISFNEITAREILTPRVNIISIAVNTPHQQITEIIKKSHLSRFPVYEDNIDNIIGILHARDWYEVCNKQPGINLRRILCPCLYVHRLMKISTLLNIFKKKRQHLAIVTDDYGGTLGIVTLEDVLEELVGDIWDESDEVHFNITPLGETTFEILGETNLREVFDTIKYIPINFQSSFTTLGGYTMECFGHLPEEGEEVINERLKLTILQREETRIAKVLVEVLPKPLEEDN